jgi:hypothetical protein
MAVQKISQLFTSSNLSDTELSKTLGEEFVLCENGNMVFHWSDFYETCDVIKSQLENNAVLMEDFKHREVALSRLALIPVWVRTKDKIHQTTMHELYEKYILNETHLMGGIDPFCPLEISFLSGTGPFKAMSIAECFNKTTYRDFVLVYLIKGKLPRRDYRVRLKSKVLLEYGVNFHQAEVVALEQLTMNGLLLSMDSETYTKKFSNLETIRILINAKMLESGLGKNVSDLKTHLSQFAFNLLYSSNKEDSMTVKLSDLSVQSSFDFAKNKRVFLFVSYAKLAETHPEGVGSIRKFVDHTKTLVREHYLNSDKKIKSA